MTVIQMIVQVFAHFCVVIVAGGVLVLAGGVELLGVMGVVVCIMIAFIVELIVERM